MDEFVWSATLVLSRLLKCSIVILINGPGNLAWPDVILYPVPISCSGTNFLYVCTSFWVHQMDSISCAVHFHSVLWRFLYQQLGLDKFPYFSIKQQQKENLYGKLSFCLKFPWKVNTLTTLHLVTSWALFTLENFAILMLEKHSLVLVAGGISTFCQLVLAFFVSFFHRFSFFIVEKPPKVR